MSDATDARPAQARPTKKLVFCFDGTWNRIDSRTPTNVLQTAASVLPLDENGIAQLVHYDEGVGTKGGLDAITGGAMGAGLTQNLADAYRFLAFNYTPGDKIYVFGFSRGAYTARSFVGLINNCGVLDRAQIDRANEIIDFYRSRRPETKPDRLEANIFRAQCSSWACVSDAEVEWRSANVPAFDAAAAPIVEIAYVGIWDTVGALGVPSRFRILSRLFNRGLEFHDTTLAPIVTAARHALAIDEDRLDFDASTWTGLEQRNANSEKAGTAEEPFRQVWFPGTHSSVGGGGDVRGLSDAALSWVWDGARLAGLRLDTAIGSRIYQLAPDPNAPIDCVDWSRMTPWQKLKGKVMSRLWRRKARQGPANIDDVAPLARRRWQSDPSALPEGKAYRPRALARVAQELDALPRETFMQPRPDSYTWHVVKRGDQLGRLAQDLIGPGASSKDIMAINRDLIDDADRIFPGRTIRIPNRVQPVIPANAAEPSDA